MANYPENLRYTKEHEWTRLSGNNATVGITSFAKDQLGDVVYLELPEVGATVTKGQPFRTSSATPRSWAKRWTPLPRAPPASGRWCFGKGSVAVAARADRGTCARVAGDRCRASAVGRGPAHRHRDDGAPGGCLGDP